MPKTISPEVQRIREQEARRRLTQRWQDHYAALKAAAVNEAHTKMMRDPWRLYLYITPAAVPFGAWGSFHIVRDCEPPPAGAELATAEPIPPLDKASIHRWLERFASQLPMIGSDDMIPTKGGTR